jgi:hypothetical protein
MSASLANVRHFIPPALVAPTPTRSETDAVFLAFVYKYRPIETEYIEKRIVVEDVDQRSVWTVDREPCLFTSY